MPDSNLNELEKRLESEVIKGAPAKLVSFLIGLDEKERRSLNKRAGRLFREMRKGDMYNVRARKRSALALLATSTAAEVTKRKSFADLASDTFDWESENNPGAGIDVIHHAGEAGLGGRLCGKRSQPGMADLEFRF